MTFGDDEILGDDESQPDDADALSEDSPLASDAEVACPYCGETITIPLDPSGGRTQEYVEDCQVCCQPCQVSVRYAADGTARVRVEAANPE